MASGNDRDRLNLMPIEILTMILTYLLVHPRTLCIGVYRKKIVAFPGPRNTIGLCPQIFQVCKSLSDEGKRILYVKNTFHFDPGFLPVDFGRHLGLRNAALVQNISFPCLNQPLGRTDMELDVFSNLKEVRIIAFQLETTIDFRLRKNKGILLERAEKEFEKLRLPLQLTKSFLEIIFLFKPRRQKTINRVYDYDGQGRTLTVQGGKNLSDIHSDPLLSLVEEVYFWVCCTLTGFGEQILG